MKRLGKSVAVLDLSSLPSPPAQYAILFDPSKGQVDALLAQHEYLVVFTFVTVAANDAPDMNWIDGYSRVVRPLWLGCFDEPDRERIAQRYVRVSLRTTNIAQVEA